MICLEDWDIFAGTDENKVFPSALELVKFENQQDLLSFSEENILLEIPEEVTKEVSRPSAIMIVMGKVFYTMVALHGKSSYTSGED